MNFTVSVTARALELNLMEYLTALLCWCERVEAHPHYPGFARAKPLLAPKLSGTVDFALRRRAELMTRNRTSTEALKEEVRRLKEMLGFLQALWQTLEQKHSVSQAQTSPCLQLN
jgi:hypothetical protein